MRVSSAAFEEGGVIPPEYTCNGKNVNPELTISGIPGEAKSLALIVDDPDAPGKTFLHWLVYDISPKERIESESVPGTQGTNDFGKNAYGGPCPPSGTHRYFFRIYALDTALNLGEGKSRAELEQAMEEHVIDQAELMGRYSQG